MAGVTTGVYGAPFGRAPLGPLSPGIEPLHPYIRARFFNIQNRYSWATEMLYQRAKGVRPNLAPPNIAFKARAQRTVTPGSMGVPPVYGNALNFGPVWAGSEGASS